MTEAFALHEIITDEKGRPCDYRFLEVNPSFERLTGLKRDEVVGRCGLEVLPGTEPYWIENYGRVALTGEPMHFENYSAPLDRWYAAFAYRPAQRQFAVVFVDSTERRRMEEALRQSRAHLEQRVRERTSELEDTVGQLQAEVARRRSAERLLRERSERLEKANRERRHRVRQLQALTGQLSMAEDRERRRLAEILHEDLQQMLVGIRFQLDALAKRVGRTAGARQSFEQIATELQQSIEKSRSLSHELSPPILAQWGLVAALRWLAGQMDSQHGLTVEVAADDRAEPADEALK
jgi:PAS domain S-box-containing protein